MAHPPTSYLWVQGAKQALSTWLEDLCWVFYGHPGWWGRGCIRDNCSIGQRLPELSLHQQDRLETWHYKHRSICGSQQFRQLLGPVDGKTSELERWSYSSCANLRTVIWGFAKVSFSCPSFKDLVGLLNISGSKNRRLQE